MEIIETQREQKMIEVIEITDIFHNGDKISSVELRINGTSIEISSQEWVCGHKTDATINIHGLHDGIIKIFNKVTKKQRKLKKSKTYVTTIESKENNLSSFLELDE